MGGCKKPPFRLSLVHNKQTPLNKMSVLHHESILEECYDEAVEQFMIANKLDYEMFRQIEDHEGVMLAIEKSARALFETRCI